jgi:ubiquinol-cytochrome c reductase iron-sulfur subunit
VKPPSTVLAAAATGLVVGAAAAAAALAGASAEPVAALLAVALVALGAAVAGLGVWLSLPSPDAETDTGDEAVEAEEVRERKGPRLTRRHVLAGAGVGAVAVTAVALPARRRIDDATARLRVTSWAAGVRLVDERGQPVPAGAVATGELFTVHPEGAEDEVDSQAVLVREPPSRIVHAPGREDWAPDGLLAYSKLCTHMACPVGLYQQRSGTLVCPCHQAVFDLLDAGRAVHGPARRALPQLPLEIDPDGYLVARGDFSGAVGTGFWGRP